MLETLQAYPLFFYAAVLLLGLVVGSFLNVVAHRLPGMLEAAWREECCELLEVQSPGPAAAPRNLLRPGSSCPHCQRRLPPQENIPVLSFLLLRGRCAGCKNRISWRYPVVETLTAALTLAVAVRFGLTPQTAFACLFTWALVALACIDIERQLLPDSITLPCLWLGLLCNYFGLFTDLHASLLGAVLGYGALWAVHSAFKLITGREGMGFGDFKLLAMLGAWAGWEALAEIILLSSCAGALAGVGVFLWRRRQEQGRAGEKGPTSPVGVLATPIPFGPFLALAGWLSLVWGPGLFGRLAGLAQGP